MPEVITGLMLLVAFQLLFVDRGFWSLILAHSTFTVAYVAVVVQARLQTFDQDLEAAARDLGAGPVAAFFRVTLPLIAPGVLGGWLLAFTLSLDDVVITQFTSGAGVNTAAVYTFGQVKPNQDLGKRLFHPDDRDCGDGVLSLISSPHTDCANDRKD